MESVLGNLDLLYVAPVLGLQLLVNGLLVGAIFALVAYGLALVWGVTHIINLAQGDFVILGGMLTYTISSQAGIHPLWALPISAVLLYGLGVVIYRLVIRRVVDRDIFVSILATFGISILLTQLMNQIFGADIQRARHDLGTWGFFDNVVTVEQIKLLAAAITAVLALGLVQFLRRSRVGQAMRATAQNPRAARLMGIDTDWVYETTFAVNAAICGAAGALVVMVWSIEPFSGLIFTIRAFMIVVVAGVGNLAGVVAAGLGLGVMENFAGFILGTEFQIGFVFALLVVILLWRNLRLGRKREVLR